MQLTDNQVSYLQSLGVVRGAIMHLREALRLVDHCGRAMNPKEDAAMAPLAETNVRQMTEELRALCVLMPGLRDMLADAVGHMQKGAP